MAVADHVVGDPLADQVRWIIQVRLQGDLRRLDRAGAQDHDVAVVNALGLIEQVEAPHSGGSAAVRVDAPDRGIEVDGELPVRRRRGQSQVILEQQICGRE